MPNQSFKYVCILLLVLSTIGSFGQVSTGTPAFGSFGGGPFDTINLGNLNVHFNIPVFSRAGRGIPFSYALNYDSSVWTVSGTSWQPVSNWGWKAQTELQEAKHCPANGGGRQYHSASACIDDYCPVGEMGVTAMGYDIFDAVEGPPGTYISYDSGQMSFGFSQSLWASTQTFIEWGNAILKTGLSNRDRQPQWQPKFRVDIDELGIYNSISGIVPELEQLQLEQSRLINSLPSDFRNELVLTINHPRLWGPLWETAMNPCEQGETLYCGHPELQREESYWRVLQNEWKNWLSELPALFSKP